MSAHGWPGGTGLHRVICIPLASALSVISLAAGQPADHAPLRLHPHNGHYLHFRGKPAVLITSADQDDIALRILGR